MLTVYNACEENGVSLPKEVKAFFKELVDNGEDPNNVPGMTIEIMGTEAVSEYSADSESGYDIDITKLPKGVRIVRVYNAY